MGLGQAEQNCTFCVHMNSCLYCCCTLGLQPCRSTLILQTLALAWPLQSRTQFFVMTYIHTHIHTYIHTSAPVEVPPELKKGQSNDCSPCKKCWPGCYGQVQNTGYIKTENWLLFSCCESCSEASKASNSTKFSSIVEKCF